jgi:hypothetical protein
VTVLTHRGSAISNYFLDQLKIIAGQFGINKIDYGNQNIITAAPAVCVLPSTLDRDWSGSSLNTSNTFNISLLVYSTSLRSDSGSVQQQCDELSEDLADYFTVLAQPIGQAIATIRGIDVASNRFGGLITAGLANHIEYSYRSMSDELMRMNRVIFTATSRTGLVG